MRLALLVLAAALPAALAQQRPRLPGRHMRRRIHQASTTKPWYNGIVACGEPEKKDGMLDHLGKWWDKITTSTYM